MIERYEEAARLSPAYAARESGRSAVDGYWLDDDNYFFVPESIDPSDGGAPLPHLFSSGSTSAQPVVERAELANMLAEAAGTALSDIDLSLATFDMRNLSAMAIRFSGADYEFDLGTRTLRRAGAADTRPQLFSPDGRFACFVLDYNVWLLDRRTGSERTLTHEGEDGNAYGYESETFLSAVSYRKRPSPRGIWSADSKWFLTHRIDERDVPRIGLIEHSPQDGDRPVTHQFRFAMPGDTAPIGTFVAIEIASGRVLEFAGWPTVMKGYSPLGFWALKSWFAQGAAWCVRTDRYHRTLELLRLDLDTGEGKIVLTETVADGYIEAHQHYSGYPNIRTLNASNEIIWYSERDGWGHLYLYDTDTDEAAKQLTSGNWVVRDIVDVDERGRKVYFTASGLHAEDDPARRSLCVVSLDGGDIQVLHSHDGDLYVPVSRPSGGNQESPSRYSFARPGFSPSFGKIVCREMNVVHGDRTVVIDLGSGRRTCLAEADPPSGHIVAKEFSALAADGETALHGVMFIPTNMIANGRLPLIDYIYPGPQIAWRPQGTGSVNACQCRALAALGFVTFMVDTRGMPWRSRALHQIGYPSLLEPQLADHAAVARQLVAQNDFIDARRIGVFGMSGGGGATARAMFDYSDVFNAGVSVCGNHNPTIGTASFGERYQGAADASREYPLNKDVAHKLVGKLMLMTGGMDENVQPSHTFELADALIRANKDFDLVVVPSGGHDLLPTCGYAQRRMWDFFVRSLRDEVPPVFELQISSAQAVDYRRAWAREVMQ